MSDDNPYQFNIRSPQEHWGGPRDRELHVVLVHPEIPGNTGNIGRLCAGANVWLHLVKPLGYELDDRYLRRAGLDYWPHVRLCVHDNFAEIEQIFPEERLFLFTKKAGGATRRRSGGRARCLSSARRPKGCPQSCANATNSDCAEFRSVTRCEA